MNRSLYKIGGGEAITLGNQRQGRLIIRRREMFFKDKQAEWPISPEEIQSIYVDGAWYGVLSGKGRQIVLDAKIYKPKVA